MHLLSVEEAVKRKSSYFMDANFDFSVAQLDEKCSCGASMLCVCHRVDKDAVYDQVNSRHFCLNEDCYQIKEGEHEKIKSVKSRHVIKHCSICWREI